MKKILSIVMVTLIVLSAFSILSPQAQATSLPPIGYWKFDEGSGTTAIDSSGNGNTGTLNNGPQWVDGKVGKALKFDGVNDYVYVPHSSSLDIIGNQMTVEYWMRLSIDWHAGMATNMGTYTKGDAWVGSMTGGTGAHRFNLAYIFPYPETNKNSWAANVWYHMADVYDGAYIRMYVNGVLDKAEPVTGSIPRSTLSLVIGSQVYFGWPWSFNGTIDELAIYNYARTAEEIWNDYKRAPVGYWKFDEGSGTVASDSSGNDNTGTLLNGPQWVNGISGTALSFDGSDDYVSIPDSSSLDVSGNQISVEFWMKPTFDMPYPSYNQIIFDKGNAYTGCIIDTSHPEIPGVYLVNLPFFGRAPSTTNFWASGTWYYLAVTYDGSNMRIYVNGVLDAIEPTTGSVQSTGYPLSIGSHCLGGKNFFKGIIDEFAIYGHTRTAEEIWNDWITYAPPVNEPPVADFRYRGPETSFTPSTIYVGSEVKFDAEPSYDPDGTITSYTWNFGDGQTTSGTDEVAYHPYLTSGPYMVTLVVTDDKGATGEISKDIFIDSLEWEIYFEIDYMTGHRPTDSVLEYIHGYFRDNGIYVYFFVDDEISPADPSVTENEFWQYEATYNDVTLYDDQAQDGVDVDADTHDMEYYLKEKWILYGTVWADNDDLLGLTNAWIKSRDNPDWLGDTVAGNYIFIAEQACDDYAQELASKGVTPEEVEKVVLMHEIGHSVGIGENYWGWIEDEQREGWIETYDPTKWSVMAKTGPKNCNADPIRYSHRYWKLKDMEYYEI